MLQGLIGSLSCLKVLSCLKQQWPIKERWQISQINWTLIHRTVSRYNKTLTLLHWLKVLGWKKIFHVADLEPLCWIKSVYFDVMQKGVAVEVSGQLAEILKSSRFCPDFDIQMLDKAEPSSEATPQVSDVMPSPEHKLHPDGLHLWPTVVFVCSYHCVWHQCFILRVILFFSLQYCHLSPFLLADKMGSSVKQCSKTSK